MSALRTAHFPTDIPVLADCPTGKFVVPVLSHPARKLSLIVPTYQEAGNIEDFLLETRQVLDRELPSQYDVIVVDDDSPDRTWMRVARMQTHDPALRLIRRRGERGLAGAVLRGYQVATGEILGTINADFQHPPQVLQDMIRLTQNTDLVVASRFCQGGSVGDWPPDRLLMSRVAFKTGKLILPEVFNEVTDPLSGCYLFRRSVIEGIEFSPLGFKTLIEILARGRATRITECPYRMQPRRSGRSKATLGNSFAFLKQLHRMRDEHIAQ
jgi:dolichol-phosphate mannosyltransferase